MMKKLILFAMFLSLGVEAQERRKSDERRKPERYDYEAYLRDDYGDNSKYSYDYKPYERPDVQPNYVQPRTQPSYIQPWIQREPIVIFVNPYPYSVYRYGPYGQDRYQPNLTGYPACVYSRTCR
jgi:hypothetical protein